MNQVRPVGRPPLHRDIYTVGVPVALPLWSRLKQAADQHRLSIGPFGLLVAATAVDYDGPYLPEVELLRLPVSASELRERTLKLTHQECSERETREKLVNLRCERPLGEELTERAADLRVDRAGFVRALWRAALDFHPAVVDQPRLSIYVPREEAARRIA